MGNSCPLHSAQPLGAKPKLKILISDRNGVPICRSPYLVANSPLKTAPSGLAWIYSEERENEIHAQIGLEIGVRLAATYGSDRRCHRGSPRFVLIVDVGSGGQIIATWE